MQERITINMFRLQSLLVILTITITILNHFSTGLYTTVGVLFLVTLAGIGVIKYSNRYYAFAYRLYKTQKKLYKQIVSVFCVVMIILLLYSNGITTLSISLSLFLFSELILRILTWNNWNK